MKDSAKRIAESMHHAVPDSSFEVRFWDDDRFKMGDKEPQFVLWFKTRQALGRTFGDGFLGFGESYMAKDIEVEGDFELLFRMGHLVNFGDKPLSLREKLRFAYLYLAHQNTIGRAPKNIAHCYDLNNDFYKLFLDENMAYTCGYFKTPDDTLDQAQENKFEHICRKLNLQEGQTLADLGCGWGGFLIHAAKNHGIKGVGGTISKMQYEYANDRINQLGLQNQIQVQLKDYRDLKGQFDRVSSIGMLEHVGRKYIPVFVDKVHELLKPGNIGLIHAIGNDTPYPDDPWISKYLFPGGHAPELSYVIQTLGSRQLSVMDIENLRIHYALTVEHWTERFEKNYDKIVEMYDETLARTYRLYLNVSSTSFRWGGNRLFQILISKGLNNDYPMTREHLYT